MMHRIAATALLLFLGTSPCANVSEKSVNQDVQVDQQANQNANQTIDPEAWARERRTAKQGETKTLKKVQTWKISMRATALSPDATVVACCMERNDLQANEVRCYDAANGKLVSTAKMPAYCSDLRFEAGGKTLLVEELFGKVHRLEAHTGRLATTDLKLLSSNSIEATSPDGKWKVVIEDRMSPTLKLYLNGKEVVSKEMKTLEAVHRLAVAADGSFLTAANAYEPAFGTIDNEFSHSVVKVWDRNGKMLSGTTLINESVCDVKPTKGGWLLLTDGRWVSEGSLHLWKLTAE